MTLQDAVAADELLKIQGEAQHGDDGHVDVRPAASSAHEVIQAHPGGGWALDAPTVIPPVWGQGEEVAWAEGEPLVAVGSDGTGKTALAQNLALRQLGIIPGPLLGLEVPRRQRVLYLAQDRPRQAARALRRMIGTADREDLDSGLLVVDQPLPPIEEDPGLWRRLAVEHQADVVYIDSLKDVVRELSAEESGLAVRRACALSVAEGIEVCLLHHDRKASREGRGVLRLDDVYGSRWITAGAGSVIALNGRSGDPFVELRHLKQPAAEVGPLRAGFDFETGGLALFEGGDLRALLRAAKQGITAHDAAASLYGTMAPTPSERERARRKLEAEVAAGRAEKQPGSAREPARYVPIFAHDLAHGAKK